jgi:hypothetical protein
MILSSRIDIDESDYSRCENLLRKYAPKIMALGKAKQGAGLVKRITSVPTGTNTSLTFDEKQAVYAKLATGVNSYALEKQLGYNAGRLHYYRDTYLNGFVTKDANGVYVVDSAGYNVLRRNRQAAKRQAKLAESAAFSF